MAQEEEETGVPEAMVDSTQRHCNSLLCHPLILRSGAATGSTEMTAPTPRRDHGHGGQTKTESGCHRSRMKLYLAEIPGQ
jgi:hypothetical protein